MSAFLSHNHIVRFAVYTPAFLDNLALAGYRTFDGRSGNGGKATVQGDNSCPGEFGCSAAFEGVFRSCRIPYEVGVKLLRCIEKWDALILQYPLSSRKPSRHTMPRPEATSGVRRGMLTAVGLRYMVMGTELPSSAAVCTFIGGAILLGRSVCPARGGDVGVAPPRRDRIGLTARAPLLRRLSRRRASRHPR